MYVLCAEQTNSDWTYTQRKKEFISRIDIFRFFSLSICVEMSGEFAQITTSSVNSFNTIWSNICCSAWMLCSHIHMLCVSRLHSFGIVHFEMCVFGLMHYHSTVFPWPSPIELCKREPSSDRKEWMSEQEKWLKQKSARWKRELCTIAMRLKNTKPCWLVERAKFIRLIRNAWHTHSLTHTTKL